MIKELENKLKIGKNTGIHCPAVELAKQVLNIFNDLGLKWCTDISYIEKHNWDSYTNNTVYYPIDGMFSNLKYAQNEDHKIINAKEFIALHTKEKKFNLENYIPKGDLKDFPKEIIARMLQYQEEQGNKKDISVFEENRKSYNKGFLWNRTEEGSWFWDTVIDKRNFDMFFKKYPKQDNQDNSQEFRVEDKVYDIILGEVGIVKEITTNDILVFGIKVVFENYGIAFYTPEGKSLSIDKYPRLFHYRDDYNYDVIDFSNLPKRQEPKRWRAKKGGNYYAINAPAFKIGNYFDDYVDSDNEDFEIGNYFQTKEEAQEVADKLKEYFKQVIQ